MLKKISASKSFGGQQLRYQHTSQILNCDMHFSIYLPSNACKEKPVPVIYWLSGLTCSDENFVQKAGAQTYAAQHNVAIVVSDTSPRGEGVPDDAEGAWDFGLGAGFYVDAVAEPWSKHYKMYSYIVDELPVLIENQFPVTQQKSIMGHSMGGHGALIIALKNPEVYACVSAFSPICAPIQCPWGKKAFTYYLGEDETLWLDYDTCSLLEKNQFSTSKKLPIWIEQGLNDSFLEEQLMTKRLENACHQFDYPMQINYHEGYDHSYFFISSFISEQIARHATQFLQK